MRKILLLFAIAAVGCSKVETSSTGEPRYKEYTIEYSEGQEDFDLYGYYKREFKQYDYEYSDSFMYSYTLDSIHHVNAFINEYGDTVCKIYVDTSNYPRREE